MKTYLVTGGAGFIGSNFIIHMLGKYADSIRIINFDKLTYAGNLENLKAVEKDERYSFIQGDICDYESVKKIFQENTIDYLVNFSAESHVDRSIYEPDVFVKTNVFGTINLLNNAKEAWRVAEDQYKEGVKFLQVSTDEVYGSLGETDFFTEKSPIDPHSPYSASKASADHFIKAYYDTYKLPINITRCSNNYGPYQFPEKLIPLIIHNALNHMPIPVYGNGLNVRDWLYVRDHCIAIDHVINNGSIGETYNIGGHNEKSNIEIVKHIIKFLNENVDNTIDEALITYVSDRKGHDKRYAIDPNKIQRELGWTPTIMFEDGIVKTIEWYLNNKEWLSNVTSLEYQKYYRRMYG